MFSDKDKAQFDEKGEAAVTTLFAGKELEVRYLNKELKDYGQYSIIGVEINGAKVEFAGSRESAQISRQLLNDLRRDTKNKITVELG